LRIYISYDTYIYIQSTNNQRENEMKFYTNTFIFGVIVLLSLKVIEKINESPVYENTQGCQKTTGERQ
jgi:hypothetical protein